MRMKICNKVMISRHVLLTISNQFIERQLSLPSKRQYSFSYSEQLRSKQWVTNKPVEIYMKARSQKYTQEALAAKSGLFVRTGREIEPATRGKSTGYKTSLVHA